jgi:hypothetical protein
MEIDDWRKRLHGIPSSTVNTRTTTNRWNDFQTRLNNYKKDNIRISKPIYKLDKKTKFK